MVDAARTVDGGLGQRMRSLRRTGVATRACGFALIRFRPESRKALGVPGTDLRNPLIPHRRTMKHPIHTLLALATLSSAAFASGFTLTSAAGSPVPAVGTGGGGGPVWPTQLPLFPAESPITVPFEIASVSGVAIQGLSHTSAGELQAALRDPNGVYYNIFVRSGFDGVATWNHGDFVGVGVNFVTSGQTPFPGGANTDIVPGNYNQDFGNSGTPPAPWPNGSQNVRNTPLNSIFGPAGTWTLVVWDWVEGETGSFTSWSLSGVRPSIESECFGDGTQSLPCPCGNSGTSGHGCNNSSNTGGAQLTASGTFTPNAIVLTSSGERPTSLTIFLQSGIGSPQPFGDGIACTGGGLLRLYVKSAVNGVATAPEPGDLSIPQRSANLGQTLGHGSFRVYHAYYRDVSASFCPGATFNVSNALRITWP